MQINLLKILLCALCIWFLCGHSAKAQVADSLSSRRLEELEVVSNAVVSASDASVPVQSMSNDDFERLGLVNAADAVKRMSGAQVQDYGGIGGLKTVSLRGLGANHTAVGYDGVAVSEANSGQVDIGRFGLDNVEMLSLVVGQADDIFMPARFYASAGMLNITTKRPSDTSTMVKAQGGSFGFAGLSARRERVFGRGWSYSAFLNAQRADGDYPFELVNGSVVTKEKRKDSDVESLNAELNLYGDFGSRGNVAAKVYYYKSERGLPGAVNLYKKNNSERLWNDDFFVQAKYKLPVTERLLVQALAKYNYSFSRYVEENRNYAGGSQTDKNTQHDYYASLGAHYTIAKSISVALTSDVTHSALRNNFIDGNEPQRLNSQTVLAAQYKSTLFTATASLLATYMKDSFKDKSKAAENKRLSPALSFSWQPLPSFPLRLRASFKDGFRVPTFADLYYLRMGNTGLKPERASQYNVGITCSTAVGSAGYISLSVDGYYNKVKDKIVALPTMYVWRMQNYGRVRMKGVDVNLSAEVALPADISLLADATYSYRHTVDYTNPESKNYGHQIPYAPRNTGNFSLTLNNRWVNISYLFTVVGKRYMLPQNIVENEIPSYVEHSVSANREFGLGRGIRLRVQGELLNVGDRNYDIIRYYPMPGRSWRISACLTF